MYMHLFMFVILYFRINTGPPQILVFRDGQMILFYCAITTYDAAGPIGPNLKYNGY